MSKKNEHLLFEEPSPTRLAARPAKHPSNRTLTLQTLERLAWVSQGRGFLPLFFLSEDEVEVEVGGGRGGCSGRASMPSPLARARRMRSSSGAAGPPLAASGSCMARVSVCRLQSRAFARGAKARERANKRASLVRERKAWKLLEFLNGTRRESGGKKKSTSTE